MPAGTSDAAIGDAAVQAARQRIINGARDPKDRAIVDRYLKEQNTPPAKPEPGQAPTLHQITHAALGAIHHAQRLTTHGGPVPVDVTERSAERIGKSGRDMLHDRRWGGQHAHITHALDRAFHRTSDMRGALRSVAMAPHVSHMARTSVDRSTLNTTTINGMTVHTRATDGREMMADLEKHLARSREVAQANSGLA